MFVCSSLCTLLLFPLHTVPVCITNSNTFLATSQGAAAATGQALLEQEQEEVDVSLVVTDGGMALISALVPGCAWQSGSAAIDLRVHGSLKEPGVEGAARLSRGLLKTPFLRSPVQGVAASLRVRRHCMADPPGPWKKKGTRMYTGTRAEAM